MTSASSTHAHPTQGPILNVSFYRFVTLSHLERLRDRLKARAIEGGLHGSILLSHEGINGFLAAEETKIRSYLDWLFSEFPEFQGIAPKESFSAEVPFARMLVKIKNEIITMGRPDIRPSEKSGKRIDPQTLKNWYDDKKDFVILDTRNDYEISQGTFKGAVHYDIETFKEFPEKLEANLEALKDKTVVMFCTGGIRCEKATALAMDLGIKEVFQLEGGILKYFEEVGGAHYRGDCFVFDQRANVDAGLAALPDRTLKEKAEGLKFTYSHECPYCLRVLHTLQAKGLPFAESLVDLKNLPKDLETLNPHGEVPILQNRALTLYQANIILAYLDENFSETISFSPEDPERRARMRLWLDWIDQTLAPDVHAWQTKRDSLDEKARFALESKLEKALYRLKTPLQRNRNFLVVDEPTQADFAASAMLQVLRKTGFPKDFPERFTPVWEWSDRMKKTIQNGLEKSTRSIVSPS